MLGHSIPIGRYVLGSDVRVSSTTSTAQGYAGDSCTQNAPPSFESYGMVRQQDLAGGRQVLIALNSFGLFVLVWRARHSTIPIRRSYEAGEFAPTLMARIPNP